MLAVSAKSVLSQQQNCSRKCQGSPAGGRVVVRATGRTVQRAGLLAHLAGNVTVATDHALHRNARVAGVTQSLAHLLGQVASKFGKLFISLIKLIEA